MKYWECWWQSSLCSVCKVICFVLFCFVFVWLFVFLVVVLLLLLFLFCFVFCVTYWHKRCFSHNKWKLIIMIQWTLLLLFFVSYAQASLGLVSKIVEVTWSILTWLSCRFSFFSQRYSHWSMFFCYDYNVLAPFIGDLDDTKQEDTPKFRDVFLGM